MDTGPDGDLDDLAALAASVAGTPRAFVTLVDARRSYWKAVVEVPADGPEDGMAEQIDLPCCRTRCGTEDLRPNPCDTPAVSARPRTGSRPAPRRNPRTRALPATAS